MAEKFSWKFVGMLFLFWLGLLILTNNNRNDEAKEFITEASKDIDLEIIIDGLQKLKQKYLVIKG